MIHIAQQATGVPREGETLFYRRSSNFFIVKLVLELKTTAIVSSLLPQKLVVHATQPYAILPVSESPLCLSLPHFITLLKL